MACMEHNCMWKDCDWHIMDNKIYTECPKCGGPVASYIDEDFGGER